MQDIEYTEIDCQRKESGEKERGRERGEKREVGREERGRERREVGREERGRERKLYKFLEMGFI